MISASLGSKREELLLLEEATTTHEDRRTFSEAQYTDSKPFPEYPTQSQVQPFFD